MKYTRDYYKRMKKNKREWKKCYKKKMKKNKQGWQKCKWSEKLQILVQFLVEELLFGLFFE